MNESLELLLHLTKIIHHCNNSSDATLRLVLLNGTFGYNNRIAQQKAPDTLLCVFDVKSGQQWSIARRIEAEIRLGQSGRGPDAYPAMGHGGRCQPLTTVRITEGPDN